MDIDLNTTYIYIINSDLKMSKGKIAAQVSHVAMRLGKSYGMIGKAIILKAPESVLKEFIQDKKVCTEYIRDAGLTEVPENSLTCVGFRQNKSTLLNTMELKLV